MPNIVLPYPVVSHTHALSTLMRDGVDHALSKPLPIASPPRWNLPATAPKELPVPLWHRFYTDIDPDTGVVSFHTTDADHTRPVLTWEPRKLVRPASPSLSALYAETITFSFHTSDLLRMVHWTREENIMPNDLIGAVPFFDRTRMAEHMPGHGRDRYRPDVARFVYERMQLLRAQFAEVRETVAALERGASPLPFIDQMIARAKEMQHHIPLPYGAWEPGLSFVEGLHRCRSRGLTLLDREAYRALFDTAHQRRDYRTPTKGMSVDFSINPSHPYNFPGGCGIAARRDPQRYGLIPERISSRIRTIRSAPSVRGKGKRQIRVMPMTLVPHRVAVWATLCPVGALDIDLSMPQGQWMQLSIGRQKFVIPLSMDSDDHGYHTFELEAVAHDETSAPVSYRISYENLLNAGCMKWTDTNKATMLAPLHSTINKAFNNTLLDMEDSERVGFITASKYKQMQFTYNTYEAIEDALDRHYESLSADRELCRRSPQLMREIALTREFLPEVAAAVADYQARGETVTAADLRIRHHAWRDWVGRTRACAEIVGEVERGGRPAAVPQPGQLAGVMLSDKLAETGRLEKFIEAPCVAGVDVAQRLHGSEV